MNIEGCVALVTGANRGLGRAYAEALLSSGAAKVYAAARDPSAILDALHTVTSVKVLSNPSLDVINNQAATLQVGDVVDAVVDCFRIEVVASEIGHGGGS